MTTPQSEKLLRGDPGMSPENLNAIDDLQRRYIDALDSKDMPAWLACFAEQPEASYICTSLENFERNLPIALMLDDCRARLQDRVTYITEIWKGTFQDYRTRHFVQRLRADQQPDGVIALRSNVSVLYTPEDTGQSEVLATGTYLDRVRVQDGHALFLAKTVVIDTRVLPRYLVYPL